MKLWKQVIAYSVCMAAGALGQECGLIGTRKALTLESAKVAMAAAVTEARRIGAPGGAIAVVDEGGHVLSVERLDGTFAAAWRISIGKAQTSAAFGKPTSVFEKIIRDGRTPMLALENFTPLQGGVPIMIDGKLVGAIGVSGAASAQQDEELAMAGAAAVVAAVSASSGMMPGNATAKDATKVGSATEKNGAVMVRRIETTKVAAKETAK